MLPDQIHLILMSSNRHEPRVQSLFFRLAAVLGLVVLFVLLMRLVTLAYSPGENSARLRLPPAASAALPATERS